jgi:membrane-associated phospholipid phosphatase
MKKIISNHQFLWAQKYFSRNVMVGLALLASSLIINYFANIYTTNHASNSVADIILDNIPVFNVEFMFVDGAAAVIIFVILLLLRDPRKIPFTVKSVATFIIIRSIFITLTHIAMPPMHSYLDPLSNFRYMSAGNDMFFSSHTGLPFLMALIFWESKKIRLFFIGVSVVFGISVLMGHLHYSIDVFAAFFITYSIFHIAQKIFRRDYILINADEKGIM